MNKQEFVDNLKYGAIADAEEFERLFLAADPDGRPSYVQVFDGENYVYLDCPVHLEQARLIVRWLEQQAQKAP